jgi:dienelactone hydrolase
MAASSDNRLESAQASGQTKRTFRVMRRSRFGQSATSITPAIFRGRIDLARLGVFGHSIGGATALLIAAGDTTIRGAIDIDGDAMGNVLTGSAPSTAAPHQLRLAERR